MRPRPPHQATKLTESPEPLDAGQLKARAIRWLATREHTRVELAQKLSRLSNSADLIESVLDDLRHGGWQSDERFAESFAGHKSSRHGSAFIAHAMRQKGVADPLIEQTRAVLAASEFERALAVWQKKFGSTGLPSSRESYAKQGRFLMGRGFSGEVIRKVLGGDVVQPEGESG